MTETAPQLDHPTLPLLKAAFPDVKMSAAEFRGDTTVIVPAEHAHAVLQYLHDEPDCDYDFLSDVFGIDYLDYPVPQPGRFAITYLLVSYTHNRRLTVKVYLDPSLDTSGIDEDPALVVDSVCDIWPGAEWREREAFDLFGVRFRNHPDLRRILTWENYPAHPLRKDYPLRGRGEREKFKVYERDE